MDECFDVVVVGAGPVGYLAAIELGLGGVRVLVLERLAAANLASKALGIGPLGTEALQRRGMGVAIAAAEARGFAAMKKITGPNGPDRPSKKVGGHFAGLSLIRKDVQKEPERRARLVDQHAVETMLADRASLLGIEVRRGSDATNVVQRADGRRSGLGISGGRRPHPLLLPRGLRWGAQPRPQDGGLRFPPARRPP